uniref:Uncharacterized protein n=1 Tax=Arcella intermedia TaxID=1963864 RepID=A0A6B2L818_9EUKA
MCCRGDGEVDNHVIEKDKNISKQLAADKKKLSEEVRLLLLGAGESGKSTIAKQMKILHVGGFNPEEKSEYIHTIHSNIYESVQAIAHASETLEIPINSPEVREIAEAFMEPFTSSSLSPDTAAKITQFYADPQVRAIMERRAEFQLLDNTEYYAREIQRICAKDYVPTEFDVLNSRVQTTGVIETSFNSNGRKFILVDVGGQRSERKKWIHCFENVTGVLFCVGVSSFDQTLYEDNATNRLHEALKLFHEICSSKWFISTAIILFFNKYDLFLKKMKEGKSIATAFPDFQGGSDADKSIAFLTEKFCTLPDAGAPPAKREIYSHVTTATDTEQVNVVFQAVKDFILNQGLKTAGLIA